MPAEIEITVKPALDLSGMEALRTALLDLGHACSLASEALLAFGNRTSAGPDEMRSVPDRCANCGHPEHGHAFHIKDLLDCPGCPCAAELRELSGDDVPAVRLASRTRTTVPGPSAGQ